MLDLSKPVFTVRGKAVKILAVVPELKFGIIGLIEGDDEATTWDVNGHFHPDINESSTLNLRNAAQS